MLRLRPLRRRLTWLMLITLVLAALAPALSRAAALVAGDLAPWSVVCAAPAATVAGPATAAGDHGSLLAHCPLCVLQADGLGMPPEVRPLLAPVSLRQAVPALFLRAPRPLHAWSAAQARAPPRSA